LLTAADSVQIRRLSASVGGALPHLPPPPLPQVRSYMELAGLLHEVEGVPEETKAAWEQFL
jgi:hypothetical protein